ncbi:hypothetical protein GCM10016455_25280 [Aliiroseovarius zhejiangensis]|uniref:Uncharacterized protein n=1 Tax=Aliiroseovarius zhejiangensis TaxID=1632025 RepID=A0ABQ3J485_9RHOB|nr:hypothetical protein [Aliiroseovarius zhejiangensis]MCK8484347.1 hypothetical protein [Aliiroseovarius sp. S2029]GHF02918.1 hypothetical protein GCM10016455_25280 [Aliiroseovarius zhejiangensis]
MMVCKADLQEMFPELFEDKDADPVCEKDQNLIPFIPPVPPQLVAWNMFVEAQQKRAATR